MILKEINVNVGDKVEIVDGDNISFYTGNMNIYKLIFNFSEELANLTSIAVFKPKSGNIYKTAIIFYENNGFVCYDKRNLEKDEMDKNSGKYLLQMLRDLSKYEIEG